MTGSLPSESLRFLNTLPFAISHHLASASTLPHCFIPSLNCSIVTSFRLMACVVFSCVRSIFDVAARTPAPMHTPDLHPARLPLRDPRHGRARTQAV